MEVYFQRNLYCDWLAIFFRGFEPPRLCGANSLCIEATSEGTSNVNVRRKSLPVYD